MSISIELNEKQLNNDNQLQMHYLPAKIDGDGEANVDTYFNNYTRKENGVLINALRGFPLQGCEIEVPNGYKGVVLQETNKSLVDNCDRKLRITGTFNEFIYWNYDKVPTKGDNYRQALQLIDVSKVLSSPVTLSDMEQEVAQQKERAASKENV